MYPKLVELAPLIYRIELLTPEFCSKLISSCISINNWEDTDLDGRFYTDDIRLEDKLPDFFNYISNALITKVYPTLQKAIGTEIKSPWTIFALKYSLQGQKNLPVHIDESHISGSIKLNNNYKGAELRFPRQNITNKDLGVGELLIWGNLPINEHLCTEILEGEKYSLTIWTP